MVCRNSLDNILNLIFICIKEKPKKMPDIIWNNSKFLRNIIETFIICLLAYIITVLFPKIEIIFSLVGSTTSTLISFVFPPLFYIKLLGNERRL
jgi:amino acid permease